MGDVGNYISSSNILSKSYFSNNTHLFSVIGNNFSTVANLKLFKGILSISATSSIIIPKINSCIDNNTYCNDTLYTVNNEPYCDFSNIKYCNKGCSNSICSNNLNNTCNVLGSRICTTTTQYGVCSDSNSDTALDFGEVHDCSIGQYCFSSFNFADCTNVTQDGVHAIYSMNIVPFQDSSDNTFYSVDEQSSTVGISTTNAIHTQYFYTITQPQYISRTCDYKETIIYSNLISENINESKSYTLTSPINSDSIIDFSIKPDINTNGSIRFESLATSSMLDLLYYRNATNKELKITKLNGTILYDDYDTANSDTLKTLDFEYVYTKSSGTYTLKIIFNRDNDNIITTYPILTTDNNIYKIIISSSGNTTFNNITAKTISSFSSFTSNINGLLGNNNSVLPCVYTSVGTRIVRTYANNNGQPDYSSYKDYNVNLKATGLTKSEVAQSKENDNINNELSLNMRYYIMLGVSVGLLLLLSLFGVVGHEPVGGFLSGLASSMLSSLTLSIIFKLSLLIPILYILIGGAIAVIITRKTTSG